MPDRATAINAHVLRWARERAGLSLEDVAARLKKAVEDVAAWESGTEAPTYRQLEELAAHLYKRPIAIFFFPAPPEEDDPAGRFRTLPQTELAVLAPDTLFAIREALALQESVRELSIGESRPTRLITRDIHPMTILSIPELASAVRSYLSVSLGQQSSWRTTEEAFKRWRQVLEASGICVFKRSFKQAEILGLSIFDDDLPAILVNNSTAHSRQVFTLFHELAHLLYSTGGITKNDSSFIEHLTGDARDTEIRCNEFAAEFLVPMTSFPWQEFRAADLDAFVSTQARRYNVSREVILRRLLDRGLVGQRLYSQKTTKWNQEYEKARQEKGGGGNYYATQASYFGEMFLRMAFNQYYRGMVTLEELAGHLRMKARNVSRLEEFMLAGE
jgi:Zn-dependent peptidase ImmA (M78 family)